MNEPVNKHLKPEAYKVYKRALRTGAITRGEKCEFCGSKDHIQGHHTDYSQPLAVVWLCRVCHLKLHEHWNASCPFWEFSPRTGRPRIHADDRARKRAWWRKHRASQLDKVNKQEGTR